MREYIAVECEFLRVKVRAEGEVMEVDAAECEVSGDVIWDLVWQEPPLVVRLQT